MEDISSEKGAIEKTYFSYIKDFVSLFYSSLSFTFKLF